MTAALAWTAVSSAAQTNDAADPHTWKITQEVINDTPYVLKRLSMTLTEETKWTKEPAASIPAHSKDEHAFSNNVPGHGLVGLVTYGAYDEKQQGAFMGMVIAISAVDCTEPIPAGCMSYHRWEAPVCDSNGNVRGRWWDNGGSPKNFHTTIQFLTNKSETCRSSIAELPSAAAPNAEWVVTAGLGNASRYTLKLRFLWNSESTHFTAAPVRTIAPGQVAPPWKYANRKLNHGPAALLMYDAFDGERYVGSAVVEAGVDCVDPTPAGCLHSHSWTKAAAGAIPGYTLESAAAGTGQPENYRVGFEVLGKKNPAAPR